MNTKKGVGYIRVSTGEQAKGYSLAGQRKEIEEFCHKNNIVLSNIFEDHCSGTKLLERQGLMSMLSQVDSSIHHIIATESDRISRDVFQYGWLLTHLQMKGVSLSFVNEYKSNNPSEKAFSKIRSVFSEFETELRQARIKRGIQIARENQQFMNRPPLGYRMENKRIVIDEATKPLVLQIFIQASEGRSIRTISRLTGVSRSTVSFVLHNPFYVEKSRNGYHDIFVSRSLWKRLQIRQNMHSKRNNRFKIFS